MSERKVLLKQIRAGAPWEAWLAEVSAFPLPPDELGGVGRVVAGVATTAARQWGLSSEVFLQIAQLHQGDGPARVAAHGKQWIPLPGLGVWPDREPPRIWTEKDLTTLAPGQTPPVLMYQVLRVTTAQEAREQARRVMLGLGTIVQMMTAGDPAAMVDRTSALLGARITETAFRGFLFYVPLLERKSVAQAKPEDLEAWLCGTSVYIRESVEDRGVLICSREPLGPVLEKLGGRLAAGPAPVWQV